MCAVFSEDSEVLEADAELQESEAPRRTGRKPIIPFGERLKNRARQADELLQGSGDLPQDAEEAEVLDPPEDASQDMTARNNPDAQDEPADFLDFFEKAPSAKGVSWTVGRVRRRDLQAGVSPPPIAEMDDLDSFDPDVRDAIDAIKGN